MVIVRIRCSKCNKIFDPAEMKYRIINSRPICVKCLSNEKLEEKNETQTS